MEQPTQPPDPTAVTPPHADAPPTGITPRPGDDPRWAAPKPAPSVGGSSALPVLTVATVALLGTCVVAALVGSWVAVVAGVVLGMLAFHYFAWGWLYSRYVAEQQRQELLKLAEQDAKLLPDPQRSRHF
jgi:hypothetical protein